MAKGKDGGKNKKFGRHGRNPSSKMQAARSARNKEKRIKAAHPSGLGHVCPKVSRRLPSPPMPIPMDNIPMPYWMHKDQQRPDFFEVTVNGWVVDISPKFSAIALSFRRAHHPDAQVWRITPLGHRVEIDMRSTQPQRLAA